MKNVFLIFIFLNLPLFSHAGPCSDSWKTENEKNKLLDICELEWSDGGIQLVRVAKGCAFPENQREGCYILRSCDKYKEIGASLFRAGSGIDSYCITGKNLEVMSSSKAKGPKAFITCSGIQKPIAIQLSNHDLKKTKSCPFPFAKL